MSDGVQMGGGLTVTSEPLVRLTVQGDNWDLLCRLEAWLELSGFRVSGKECGVTAAGHHYLAGVFHRADAERVLAWLREQGAEGVPPPKPQGTVYREREYLEPGSLRDPAGIIQTKKDRLAAKMAAVIANRVKEGKPLEIRFGGVVEAPDPVRPDLVELECRAVVKEVEG